MTRLKILTLAAMAALVLSSSSAGAASVLNLSPLPPSGGGSGRMYEPATAPPVVDSQPTLQARHFGAITALDCAVAGRPDALLIVNRGADPLPAGTRIKWQLREAGIGGFFALLNELGAGATLQADGVLDAGVAAGATCLARVI